jgi:hypothetical protein
MNAMKISVDLHAHDRVHVSLVPPVVPDARLDLGPLSGSQNRLPTVAQHRQLALLNAEALDQCRMQVLTRDTRTGQRGQVGDRTTLIVQPRQFNDDAALQCHRIGPDLARLDRTGIRSGKAVFLHDPCVARRDISGRRLDTRAEVALSRHIRW